MHKRNEGHRQKQLFSFLSIIPKNLRKRIEDSIYPLFYEEVFCQIDEEIFAPLYSKKASRPNCPVNLLVGLEILKYLHDLSDKQLFDTYARDLGYRVALGLQDLSEGELSIRTLYNFRSRVVAYTEENGINPMQEVFETLTARFIEKAGVQTDIIRMDSTQISSNMKRMSRVTIMSRTLQQFLKGLETAEIERYAEAYENYISEDKRKDFLERITNPTQALERVAQDMLIVLIRYEKHPVYAQQKAYHLLERVLNDQTVVVEEQLSVKAGKEIASDSCQSPFDPDATYIQKNGKGYCGYSANITETANPENDVQLIMQVQTQPNVHSDKAFLNEELNELTEKTDMNTLVVDGGYSGEEIREKVAANGFEFIETGLKGKEPRCNSAAFEIDATNGILRCPMGKEPLWSRIKSKKAQALFSHESCKGCPYADKCFAKKQTKGMKVDIELKRYERDKRRVNRQSEAFQKKKNLRPAIEGTISVMKRSGLNNIKVRGLIRVQMTVLFNAIGYNLKRVFRVSQIMQKNKNKPPLLLNRVA